MLGEAQVPRQSVLATWLERIGQWCESPWRGGLLALIVYGLCAIRWNRSWEASQFAYFNYLADAFLHGQLHLRLLPSSTLDLVFFNGQYFLYWPPFPALLLLPVVAIFGVSASDILFTVCLGALNVALISLVLRTANARRVIELAPAQRGWLVLFFALGTVHLTLAPFGRVWYTGQLITVACTCVVYLAALRLRGASAFLGIGLGLAAALLTRNHVVLIGLWPLVYLIAEHRTLDWRRLGAYILISGVPVLAAVALFGAYNYLRFGSVLDNGLRYHQMSGIFVEEFQRYGAFNLFYLPRNVFYQLLAYPLPYNTHSLLGGGLFWLSPVFVGAVWGVIKGRPRWSVWTLAATIGLVLIPIWLLMGTGWEQFGPRYTLDFIVPLLLLTALGIRRWPLTVLAALTLLSMLQYFIGMIYWGAYMSVT